MSKRRWKNQGASLIEVLVAALILSLGMLALIGVQASVSQVSKVTQFRAEAVRLGQDYADRIRANNDGLGSYTVAGEYSAGGNATAIDTPDPNCATAICSAAQLAAFDKAQMRNRARLALPAGDFRVTQDTVDGLPVMNIWVLWLPAEASGDGSTLAGLGCPADVNSSAQCQLTRITL